MAVRVLGLGVMLLALVFSAPAFAAAAAPHPLKGVALVIGETNYVRLPVLTNPDKDAHDVDHMLDDLGFDVTRALDVTSADLQGKINDFIADAKNADVALVYYAGHGIEAGGKDYMMGTDADISSADAASQTLISLDDTLDKLRQAVPVTILLLDACRTNPFGGQQTLQLTGDGAPVPIGSTGLDVVRGTMPVGNGKPDSGLGMVIGFSASPGQSALDGEPGSNSPYAAALLQHLTAGGFSFGDIMTMVTQEVYVDTGARQLPWTSSSLSRVLYFGRSADAPTGDDAQILGDRRKLLLDIAAVPDQSKAYVEAVATQEDLKLADLYAMLETINGNKGATDDNSKAALLDVAKRVREVLDDPILSGAPTDPELARLDGLANKAIAAGAFKRAFDYRQQEAKRAAQIEKSLDSQQAQIDTQRKELAGVYARVAEAAMYTLDTTAEANAYKRAASQSDLFDKSLSVRLRLRAANALADQQNQKMDEHSGQVAIAIYKDVLKDIDVATQPKLWGEVQLRMGWTMWGTANRRDDRMLEAQSVDAARAALQIFKQDSDPRNWTSAELLLAESLRHYNDQDAEAMDVLAKLLAATDKGKFPLDWANAQQSNGELLYWLGFGMSDVDTDLLAKAVEAFDAAATASERYEYWLHVLMLAKKAEVATYLAIREGDKPAILNALSKGREALALWAHPGSQQWGDQATYLGRNLLTAGVFLGDATILKEGLALTAKAEKTIRRDNNISDWSHMREADGDALAFLGIQGPQNAALLRAAITAYDDASEGIADQGHFDFDRPKLKKIKIEQLLGQKLSGGDAALANLPPPAQMDFSAARISLDLADNRSQFDGFHLGIDKAKYAGVALSFRMFLMVDYSAAGKIPNNVHLLRVAVESSVLSNPQSRSATYDHCGPVSAQNGDQLNLHFGNERYLNACIFSKMAPIDAAWWEAIVDALPGLIHTAALAGDKTAATVDQIFAAKPARPAAVTE